MTTTKRPNGHEDTCKCAFCDHSGNANGMYGKKHSEASRKKMSASSKGTVPWNAGKKVGCLVSPEGLTKISKANTGRKHTPEAIQKMRDAAKGRKFTPQHIANMKKAFRTRKVKYSNTLIELKTANALTTLLLSYTQNTSVAAVCNVDFYIETHSLVIQCDGCYWHACPMCKRHGPKAERREKLDRKQDAALLAKGYRIIRMWEHDINALSVEELAEHITNKL